MLALTRGAPFSLSQLLNSFNPLDHIFTGVCESEEDLSKCFGQVYQSQDVDSAQLNYVLPAEDDAAPGLVVLLEGLIRQAGHWGAKQVTADLPVDSNLFSLFRRAGFSVLAKQRVFCCDNTWNNQAHLTGVWRFWDSKDVQAMRSLHAMLVPPVVQPVEPLTRRKKVGLVYYDQDGDLKAYADLVYGPVGAWVLPFIHPQTKEAPADLLCQLLKELPGLNGRHVYIIARSYQPWIENALLGSPAQPGPEQALMVRYMALRQRVKPELSFGALENGKPEPTVPLAPIRHNRP